MSRASLEFVLWELSPRRANPQDWQLVLSCGEEFRQDRRWPAEKTPALNKASVVVSSANDGSALVSVCSSLHTHGQINACLDTDTKPSLAQTSSYCQTIICQNPRGLSQPTALFCRRFQKHLLNSVVREKTLGYVDSGFVPGLSPTAG